MASKNKPKNNESKSIETKNDASSASPKSEKRYEAVDPKRVYVMLEKLGLPTEGVERDRTDRLEAYFVHEERKGVMKLADCLPDNDEDLQGCGFVSNLELPACPFCGKEGEVVGMPTAPAADRDIELNIVAAEKKAAEKKTGGVAKVNSKAVKEKKKARNEAIDEKPSSSSDAAPDTSKSTATNTAIEPTKPPVLANDLPSEAAGGTAADLDRLASEIDVLIEKARRAEALSMWQIGRLLAEIKEKTLWSTVRHEDGSYAYMNFNSFVAQRFAFSPGHGMLMVRIATSMSEKDAEIGVAKAKAILDAGLPSDMTAQLIAYAAERDDHGNFTNSLVKLQARIKDIKNPQLPSTTPQSFDEDEEDLDDDDLDDEDDDDIDDDPKSSKPVEKPAAKSAQMTSVSFESKTFSVPLAIKGSQIKPAKKISDEPHGTLQTPGGAKIHFKVVIGEDGQLFVEGSVDTPY